MTEAQGKQAQTPIVLLPSVEIEGTKRRILEAAIELFAEYGYHGVNVKKIAEAAGIQAGSIYVHFSSKEQMLYEMMRIGHVEHRDRLHRAARDAGIEPVSQLRAIVKAHVWVHATYPLLATIGHQDLSALSQTNLKQVLALRDESAKILLDAVERGKKAGVFTYPDTWLAVAAIGGMGVRVASWFRPGHEFASLYSADAVAEAYADFAVRILNSPD